METVHLGTTLEEHIRYYATSQQHKTAIICNNRRISYGELYEKMMAAAHFMRSDLLLPLGATVLLSARKTVEFVFAYLGAHLAGIRVVPMDPDLSHSKLKDIIELTKPDLLIGYNCPSVGIASASLDKFDLPIGKNFSLFIDNNRIADIMFTTGTTGMPKGVPLSHKNLTAATRNINEFMGIENRDVEVLALPLGHSFGLGRLRCCLSVGGTICIVKNFSNIKKLFDALKREQATVFSMVPASYRLMKRAGYDLGEFSQQLKFVEMGSDYLEAHEKLELSSLLPNTRICMHYGLTEASRSVFMEFHDAKRDDILDSVGRPSPHTEIGIFDDDGNPCQVEELGEICVSGDHVMDSYLGMEHSACKEIDFFGKFFRTGDLGYRTNDGYIYLKGRKKDIINVGGKKVSPTEVENVLMKVSGIVDCACIPASDPQGILGEVVKAVIVKKETSSITFDDIRLKLIGQLENYKIPVLWSCVESIPRTENGKIQRKKLL